MSVFCVVRHAVSIKAIHSLLLKVDFEPSDDEGKVVHHALAFPPIRSNVLQ